MNVSGSASALDHHASWTDDLPVCHNSGVGYEINKAYRHDGYRTEQHRLEDFSFHFELDRGLCLYALFDGRRGDAAARFAQQRMPAELCFGQLSRRSAPPSDQAVSNVLVQAFAAVEAGFFESIGAQLAERAMLLSEPPDCLDEELSGGSGDGGGGVCERLQQLNRTAECGTSALLAVVFDRRLFVAGVGDSRALLCSTHADGVLRVRQLSTDHRLDGHGGARERERLRRLGVDANALLRASCDLGISLGSADTAKEASLLSSATAMTPTSADSVLARCLGDHVLKTAAGGAAASLSSPDVALASLDESCRFLLLVSRGLCEALEETCCAGEPSEAHVNRTLAQLVVQQFGTQTTLDGVAQSVVNRVARDHHDRFINSHSRRCQRCEDMTLLVRNFSYPLRSTMTATTQAALAESPPATTTIDGASSTATSETVSSDAASVMDGNVSASSTAATAADGRVKAYVSFDEFHAAVAAGVSDAADDSWWKQLLGV